MNADVTTTIVRAALAFAPARGTSTCPSTFRAAVLSAALLSALLAPAQVATAQSAAPSANPSAAQSAAAQTGTAGDTPATDAGATSADVGGPDGGTVGDVRGAGSGGPPLLAGDDGVGGIEFTGGGRVTPFGHPGGKRTPPPSVGGGTPDLSVITPVDHGPHSASAWEALGGGLAGAYGTPELSAAGGLSPGAPLLLRLEHAPPNAWAHVIVGTAMLGAPYKGGTMVPDPEWMWLWLPVGADGTLELSTAMTVTLPSQLSLYVQMWVSDNSAPHGLSATNGITATMP